MPVVLGAPCRRLATTADRPQAFLLSIEQGFAIGRLVVEAKYGAALDGSRHGST